MENLVSVYMEQRAVSHFLPPLSTPPSQKDQVVSSHPLKVQYLCLALPSKFKVSVFFSLFMTSQEMPRGQSQSAIDPYLPEPRTVSNKGQVPSIDVVVQ